MFALVAVEAGATQSVLIMIITRAIVFFGDEGPQKRGRTGGHVGRATGRLFEDPAPPSALRAKQQLPS